MPDADFDRALQNAKQIGLPVPAANTFLPATLKVTGPATDAEQELAYVRKALDRVSKLGVQVVVFGSGGARRVPDGFSKEDAFKQLVAFGKRIAPEARTRGITIAVEPLRKEETNIINSAREGLALVEAIDDANFQLMIDFFHLASEHEDPAIVSRAKDHLHLIVPQRFYAHQQRGNGDRHMYAVRTRFIPDVITEHFEQCAWPRAAREVSSTAKALTEAAA